MNQYFEAHPYDMMAPWPSVPYVNTMRRESKVSEDKDVFRVTLDVHQFSPDQITVKTKDQDVIVEGKHDEKEEQHCSVTRHFVRRYVLPEGYNPKDVTSSLSTDGVLSIIGPKEKSEATAKDERIVTISPAVPMQGMMDLKINDSDDDDDK